MDYKLGAYDVHVGIDVGKSAHFVCGITTKDQELVFCKEVAQGEAAIRAALEELSNYGSMLITVDQIGNIGRLVLGVAHELGYEVAFLTPYDFKRIAETYTEAKSDRIDAFILADVSMRMPSKLYEATKLSQDKVDLAILCAQHDSLTVQSTRLKNQMHDLLVQVHPSLESVFSKSELAGELSLRLIARYGGPLGFKRAGKKRVSAFSERIPYQKNRGPKKVASVFEALASQTITLPGTGVADVILKRQAGRILAIKEDLDTVDGEIRARFNTFPEARILLSMPGIGLIFGATILSELGDIKDIPSPKHLASLGGVVPLKRQSGTSLDSKKKKKRYNRRLKNAFYESARISISCDPRSAAYYEKKVAEGKPHRIAVTALARRRVDILYAMLKTGTLYRA